jgi:hypothetical protein
MFSSLETLLSWVLSILIVADFAPRCKLFTTANEKKGGAVFAAVFHIRKNMNKLCKL